MIISNLTFQNQTFNVYPKLVYSRLQHFTKWYHYTHTYIHIGHACAHTHIHTCRHTFRHTQILVCILPLEDNLHACRRLCEATPLNRISHQVTPVSSFYPTAFLHCSKVSLASPLLMCTISIQR